MNRVSSCRHPTANIGNGTDMYLDVGVNTLYKIPMLCRECSSHCWSFLQIRQFVQQLVDVWYACGVVRMSEKMLRLIDVRDEAKVFIDASI